MGVGRGGNREWELAGGALQSAALHFPFRSKVCQKLWSEGRRDEGVWLQCYKSSSLPGERSSGDDGDGDDDDAGDDKKDDGKGDEEGDDIEKE